MRRGPCLSVLLQYPGGHCSVNICWPERIEGSRSKYHLSNVKNNWRHSLTQGEMPGWDGWEDFALGVEVVS